MITVRDKVRALGAEETKTILHNQGYFPVDSLGDDEAFDKLASFFESHPEQERLLLS